MLRTIARGPRAKGFTLTELLVVIAIILLVSAATLPTALVALAEREVSDAASTVQATFSLTRDAASGGEPRGIRLLPDPDINKPTGAMAANRMVILEPAPNYSEGLVIPVIEVYTQAFLGVPGASVQRLAIYEAKTDSQGLIASPTSWYYNIRQGDKIRIEGAGVEYTIVGPMTVGPNFGNSERFINQTVLVPNNPRGLRRRGNPQVRSLPTNNQVEVLYLTNGRDDSDPATLGYGYTDESFDGLDNNGDQYVDPASGIISLVDPAYNGIDEENFMSPAQDTAGVDDPREHILSRNGNNLIANPAVAEFETEAPIGDSFEYMRINNQFDPSTGEVLVVPRSNPSAPPIPISQVPVRYRYSISRRPYVSPNSQEISLPSGAVIDLTTSYLYLYPSQGKPERSRVPIDPVTGYVDFLIYPDGRVVPSTPYGFTSSMTEQFPFYYLWIAEREDVVAPVRSSFPRLPVPLDAKTRKSPPPSAPPPPPPPPPPYLEGERRMVVVSPNSGHASVSPITKFSIFPDEQHFPYTEATRFQQTGGSRP